MSAARNWRHQPFDNGSEPRAEVQANRRRRRRRRSDSPAASFGMWLCVLSAWGLGGATVLSFIFFGVLQ